MNNVIGAIMDYGKIFIQDLEYLLNGLMTTAEFRAKYIDGKQPINIEQETNGKIPDLTGIIGHYITDEDVRGKNPAYKKMQDDSLKELISLLKKNASKEEILKITM